MCDSIEEILAESEESDLEVDAVSAAQPKKKKKKDLKMWIHEDADNIVDFTDKTAARKITGTYTELLYIETSLSSVCLISGQKMARFYSHCNSLWLSLVYIFLSGHKGNTVLNFVIILQRHSLVKRAVWQYKRRRNQYSKQHQMEGLLLQRTTVKVKGTMPKM